MAVLESQRHLYDIPDDVAYLNCAYMSPLLKVVREAGERAVALKSSPWDVHPVDFFTRTEHARELFAELIACRGDDVSIIPSVSYGMATAVLNLHLRGGTEIVTLGEQFPSNVYAWRELARERNLKLTTIERPANGDWTGAVLEQISSDTSVVALPNCHWIDGGYVDLKKIGPRCREIGTHLVVDLTQSVGAMPFDTNAVKPAFVVAAGYKYMMGPYSLGFMYVSPEFHDGRPLEHNWMSRAGSEDFARLIDYQDEFQPGARRFDVGEKSNFALMPMAVAALEQILEWGVDAIQESISERTALLAAEAAHLGLHAIDSDLRCPHYLSLNAPDGLPPNLVGSLAAQQVFISVRGDSMRVTPHVYNSDEDLDHFLGCLDDLLAKAL